MLAINVPKLSRRDKIHVTLVVRRTILQGIFFILITISGEIDEPILSRRLYVFSYCPVAESNRNLNLEMYVLNLWNEIPSSISSFRQVSLVFISHRIFQWFIISFYFSLKYSLGCVVQATFIANCFRIMCVSVTQLFIVQRHGKKVKEWIIKIK